jgi:hypothetical protein
MQQPKMKKIIALILLTTIVGGMLGLSLAKEKPVASNPQHIVMSEKSYTKNMTDSWCPVVGDGKAVSNEFHVVRDENGVEIYQHCQKCLTGVITAHADGEARCTFCGK